MIEHLVKRTIWVAQCVCGHRVEWTDNPPREILCPDCSQWVKPVEVSFTGPDIKGQVG